jgi:hypothetical protein
LKELKARIEKMNDTIERIDRHQNRIKTLSIKHKDQVGLLPARASELGKVPAMGRDRSAAICSFAK